MADEKDLITPTDEKAIIAEPEIIKEQMEETRAKLTDKLEVLEQKVVSSVEGAATTVTNTVQEVQDKVHSSLVTVRDFFDVRAHVQERPWAMLGGALVVGFVGGWLLGGRNGHKRTSAAPPMRFTSESRGNGQATREQAREPKPSWLASIASHFAPELEQVKSMAIGTVGSLLRDVLTQAIPETMKARTANVMDSLTEKLGGQPIDGPVLPPSPESTKSDAQHVYSCPSC